MGLVLSSMKSGHEILARPLAEPPGRPQDESAPCTWPPPDAKLFVIFDLFEGTRPIPQIAWIPIRNPFQGAPEPEIRFKGPLNQSVHSFSKGLNKDMNSRSGSCSTMGSGSCGYGF